ncbi:hypothetical protein GCM10007161_07000 [Ignatzschineria indica]|uniref:Uncharacterized protein n=1 Tax=Ignatzschineria indica TaxID=472583 RepID=A0A2U2ANF3_9GAMM|nr:hypothetical protein [Ignatzschineria indica]PWD84666.1 hypothetical protein DC082_03830 [Ignatzschineria indica]GGZ78208.1 hypothetical protein GCM10007161_07000 [Ignatzschineria indica]
MTNKKASIIAIIAVVIIFMIYDRFKPLSEEKIIAKQGVATLYLDNSYKNIDSTQAPAGTLLAQYSNRHDITVMVTGSHLTADEAKDSLENYSEKLIKGAPEGTSVELLEVIPQLDEIYYTITAPEKLYTWQRLKRDGDQLTVIAVTAEEENPKVDPLVILKEAQFGAH